MHQGNCAVFIESFENPLPRLHKLVNIIPKSQEFSKGDVLNAASGFSLSDVAVAINFMFLRSLYYIALHNVLRINSIVLFAMLDCRRTCYSVRFSPSYFLQGSPPEAIKVIGSPNSEITISHEDTNLGDTNL